MTEMSIPNPPAKRRVVLTVALVGVAFVALVVFLFGSAFLIRSVIASGITNGPDNMFGDQHLKTGRRADRAAQSALREVPRFLAGLEIHGTMGSDRVAERELLPECGSLSVLHRGRARLGR
jgi:hypothetical protein